MDRVFRVSIGSVVPACALILLSGLAGIRPADARGRERDGVPDMVARALPAVVSVTTRQIERDQFNQPVPMRGLGSGFIVDRLGHVLTNNHVVEGAEEIKVTFADGHVFRARLVGADSFTDLAVLKIESSNLHPRALRFGDSDRLRIGERVVAIGNPLWIEGGPTVTAGVVSALGRSMEQEGLPLLHGLIQTDAAINAGNSGGPLLNAAGEVVGINTARISSAHGIGFAIAINTAKPVLRALTAHGAIVRPGLNFDAVSVTPQVAYANNLPLDRGALVLRVTEGGAGDRAGLRPGDVITAMGATPVRDLHQLHDALWRRAVGDTVQLTVWREGATLTVTAILEESK